MFENLNYTAYVLHKKCLAHTLQVNATCESSI